MKLSCLLCILVFGLSDLALAQAPARNEIDATEIDVSRLVSRSILAVQREERDEAQAMSSSALLNELKKLRGALRTEFLLSFPAAPPAVVGASATRDPATLEQEREARTRRARAEQRGRILGALARAKGRGESLDAERRDLRSPRQRILARQAIRKARLLEQEIRAALELDPPARRERLRGLRDRLGGLADAHAETSAPTAEDTPTLRSIVRHRRVWGNDMPDGSQ